MDRIELPIVDSNRERTLDILLSVRGVLPFTGTKLSPWIGGRSEALRRLDAFDVNGYTPTRNRVGDSSGVSRLSPYIRHGLLSLSECRTRVLASSGSEASRKFIQELAWREYFGDVHRLYGDAIITHDLEAPKVRLERKPLPDDIRYGSTGLACMDENIADLREIGYVYNHARMWLASYVVHYRGVAWQAGAAWFFQHLLDGDPASNSLGWQWVASTASHKAYVFDQMNVLRNADHCMRCSHFSEKTCPFVGMYERAFLPPMPDDEQSILEVLPTKVSVGAVIKPLSEHDSTVESDLILIHGEHLGRPSNTAMEMLPDVPALFIFDTSWVSSQRISLKRLGFMYESVSESLRFHAGGGQILVGDAAHILGSLKECRRIATTEWSNKRFDYVIQCIRQSSADVDIYPSTRMTPTPKRVERRFTRWWDQIAAGVLSSQHCLSDFD